MERKNDALGREFVETRIQKDAKGVVTRAQVSSATRVYTIAGRYTRALTDEELFGSNRPLRDDRGMVLPSVYPAIQTQTAKKRRS